MKRKADLSNLFGATVTAGGKEIIQGSERGKKVNFPSGNTIIISTKVSDEIKIAIRNKQANTSSNRNESDMDEWCSFPI